MVLLSGDPHLHTCAGHAEAQDHARGRDLPGPGLRDRWSDQGIQRRRPLPAGGDSISTTALLDEQTCQEQRVTYIFYCVIVGMVIVIKVDNFFYITLEIILTQKRM